MRPPQLVLDTSAYSRLRVGHSGIIDWLTSAAVVYVPTIVLGELSAGFRLGSRRAENEQTLSDFLAEPFVEVRTADRAAAVHYGDLFARLRRAGTPIPTNDIWIAAVTLSCGSHLLTFDQDFARIDGLPHTLLR